MKLILPEQAGEEKIRDFWARCKGRMGNPGAVWPKGRTYEEWLRDTAAHRMRPPEGKVPSMLLFLTDGDETKLYGAASVRWETNARVLERSGHIGYGIAPEERRKGYAKTQLRLALGVARSLGLERALVTCLEENGASRRTIESCGGVYEDTREWGPGERLRRYWFTVAPPTLETTRLRLRERRAEDAPGLFGKRGSGEVWAIEEKASGRAVGSVGLYRDPIQSDPTARVLGCVLSETRRGRGYEKEAAARLAAYGFEALALENISIVNEAEECGCTLEGTANGPARRTVTRDEYFLRRRENVEAE